MSVLYTAYRYLVCFCFFLLSELIVSDRHTKMEIMKLEEELPLWRTVIDTGSPPGMCVCV